MISHKYKCIFVHIPKCAGSSINKFILDGRNFDWRKPNYEYLYGWCPKRKIHLQHATARELLETELVSEECWNTYYKFTVVRNSWDRAYSDYLWIQEDTKIKGSFKDFVSKSGNFYNILNDKSTMLYRGDHLKSQLCFFDLVGSFSMDKVLQFNQLEIELQELKRNLKIERAHPEKLKYNSNKLEHYSFFYTKTKMELIQEVYKKDIELLSFHFEDEKRGLRKIKNFF